MNNAQHVKGNREMNEPQQELPPERDNEPPAAERIIDAKDLFQGSREIYLDLDGVRYRLRITRRNKLILQK